MIRRALTYQLILAVAVGPLLCCCTTGQLLASIAPAPACPAPTSHSPTPTHRVSTPCCAHQHNSAKPNASRDTEDSKPAPAPSKPGGKCPCKDDAGETATDHTVVASFDISSFLRTVELDYSTAHAVVGGILCTAHVCQVSDPSRGRNAALPSTSDLLFAHHNLRC